MKEGGGIGPVPCGGLCVARFKGWDCIGFGTAPDADAAKEEGDIKLTPCGALDAERFIGKDCQRVSTPPLADGKEAGNTGAAPC